MRNTIMKFWMAILFSVLGSGLLLSNPGLADARQNEDAGTQFGVARSKAAGWSGEYTIYQSDSEKTHDAAEWDCLGKNAELLCSLSER